jgi:hypothetical protein
MTSSSRAESATVVGVLRRAERRVLRRAAHGELVEVGLADGDGTGGGQALHDGGVVRRAPALEDPRRARGRDAPGAEVVLEGDRHAGERAHGLPGGHGPVDRRGGGPGLVGQHEVEGVDVALALVDAGQVLVQHLGGAALPGLDGSGDVDGRRGHSVPPSNPRRPTAFGSTLVDGCTSIGVAVAAGRSERVTAPPPARAGP